MTPQERQQKNGKPHKEIDRNEKVLVAVSTDTNQQKAHFLKITVMDSLSKKDLAYEVPSMIHNSATVITDGRSCYAPLQSMVEKHQIEIVRNKKRSLLSFS
jgi:hypothetical protein